MSVPWGARNSKGLASLLSARPGPPFWVCRRVRPQPAGDALSRSPPTARAKKSLERCTADAEAHKSSELGKAEARFVEAGSPAEKLAAALKVADAAEGAQDYGTAARWLLKALALDGADRAMLEARVVGLIDSKIALKDVRSLLEETSGDGFPKKELTYKLGRTQYHVRDLVSAKTTLEEFVAKWPTGPLAEEAKRILELIRTRGLVNMKTIGVLVPSSGKLKAYGESVLQAVRLASGELADKKGAAEDQHRGARLQGRRRRGRQGRAGLRDRRWGGGDRRRAVPGGGGGRGDEGPGARRARR